MNPGASDIGKALFKPVDIASLVVFRVAFGLIMLWEVVRYFSRGWITKFWVEPIFHFTYPGFEWVRPWPGDGMHIHMALLGVLATLIAAGAFYRFATVTFFLGFTYTFLLERALYLNHLYLVCLVSFLLIFVPAHRAFSFDAWRSRSGAVQCVPAWSLWLLRAQLAIVYFYAGIAKLNGDWFRAEPIRAWLSDKQAHPVVGWMFEHDATFYALAWGGLLFDLLIVPCLLWKRTRPLAFATAICFHLLNVWFFRIGIFPWLSIAYTTLFFSPDWPRKFAAALGFRDRGQSEAETFNMIAPRKRRWIMAMAGAWVGIQLLIPLRHWLYPGDVAWTEEGHEFSWRMKLRAKSGEARFVVRDLKTGETWDEDPESYLHPWQVSKMVGRPDLLRQFAHFLREAIERELKSSVEVRALTMVRLNDRTASPLVDPSVDLSRVPYSLQPADWITPAPPSPYSSNEPSQCLTGQP